MRLGDPGGLVCTGNGTLGILIKSTRAPGKQFILTCSHVAARSGHFPVPFDRLLEPQRRVQTPVPRICDRGSKIMGHLSGLVKPSELIDRQHSDGDFAVVLADGPEAASLTAVQQLTNNTLRYVAKESPDQFVGLRTRLLGSRRHSPSSGTVRQYKPEQLVSISDVGTVTFNDVLIYDTPCRAGDSGAAVIDEQERLLGIHIAGSEQHSIGVFLPLGAYMDAHELELCH